MPSSRCYVEISRSQIRANFRSVRAAAGPSTDVLAVVKADAYGLGLEPVLFIDQSHYLLQIGESEIAEIVERTAGQPSKERAAIQQLIHPEMMGTTFKVLVQRKAWEFQAV